MLGLDNEEWRSIHNYPEYEVSNCGRVRLCQYTIQFENYEYVVDSSMLRPYSNNGHLFVNFKGKSHAIHRLVASEFLNDGKKVNRVTHIDNNSYNNHHTNLSIHKELAASKLVKLNSKIVHCVEDDKYYKSIKCAAIDYNLSYNELRSAINTGTPLQGHTFIKLDSLPEDAIYEEVDESKGCLM